MAGHVFAKVRPGGEITTRKTLAFSLSLASKDYFISCLHIHVFPKTCKQLISKIYRPLIKRYRGFYTAAFLAKTF